MRIENLLEGTVKAPVEVVDKLMSIACSHVFSQMMAFLESDDEYFENIHTLKRFIGASKRRYGEFEVKPIKPDAVTRDVVMLRADDVDPRYLKRAPRFKQRRIFVYVSNSKEGSFGLYLPKGAGQHPTIRFYAPSYDTIVKYAKSPEFLDSLMDSIESVIEHELMHAIQQLVLNVLSIDGEGHMGDDGEIIDNDEYMTDKDEFSPMIVTHAKQFTSFLKEAKAKGNKYSREQIREVFNSFVNPTAPVPDFVDMRTPDFFEVLYRKDKKKWKVAVKYLYDKIRELM